MKYFISWGPVLAWTSVIYFLSTRQSVAVSNIYIWNFIFFKTLHLFEYAVLFLLYVRAFNLTIVMKPVYFFIAFLFTVLSGATDEFHQMFVATRQGTIRDVIIDATGALSVWIFLHIMSLKAPKKLKRLVKRLELPI